MLSVLCADGGSVAAPEANYWRLRQVFEFIAFFHKRVEILVILVAKNEGKYSHYLDVVHRGAVLAKPIQACPLPEFPEPPPPAAGEPLVEDIRPENAVFTHLRRRFRPSKEADGEFRPRASCYELSCTPEPICGWKPPTKPPSAWYLDYCRSTSEQPDRYMPFTTLRLGQFAPGATHLVALYGSVLGETYVRLVGNTDQIPINGMELVASAIRHEDLPSTAVADPWKTDFDRLTGSLCMPDFYELFLARPPLSAPLTVCSTTSSLVPVFDVEEDNWGSFYHFATRSPDFALAVRLGAPKDLIGACD